MAEGALGTRKEGAQEGCHKPSAKEGLHRLGPRARGLKIERNDREGKIGLKVGLVCSQRWHVREGALHRHALSRGTRRLRAVLGSLGQRPLEYSWTALDARHLKRLQGEERINLWLQSDACCNALLSTYKEGWHYTSPSYLP